MNKTINCNLAGIVFHLDEDAYNKLSVYLDTIRRYFEGSDGQDEILADIEARFAELFQEKLVGQKEVVSLADVNEAINIMGEPEVYLDEEEAVKDKEYSGKTSKRIFRNPDDEIIGGVCGGLAAYFGTDAIIFRLLFLLLFFGFGSGIVFYIILWIIIPEAKTAADKLAMKGKPITASNIGKVVAEEFDNVKSKVGSQAKKFSSKGDSTKNNLEKLFEGVFELLGLFLTFILKLFGFVMVLCGILILIGLLSGVFGFGFVIFPFIDNHPLYNVDFEILTSMLLVNPAQSTWIIVGLLLFGIVPLIHLLYVGVKMLFKLEPMPRFLSLGLASVWIIGLIIIAGNIFSIAVDFRSHGYYNSDNEIAVDSGQTLILQLEETFYEYDDYDVDFTEQKDLMVSDVEIDVNKSYNDKVVLRIENKSRGMDKRTAFELAKNISYEYELQDSVLTFDDHFVISKKDKWRGQLIEMELLIPVGQKIFLSEKMRRIIFDIDNVHNMWDYHMVNHTWQMRPEGLTCLDCNPADL